MGATVRVTALSFLVAIWASSPADARGPAQANTEAIACRVLESHASENPAVTVAIFHQQNKDDQARVGEILRMHSGERVEIQIGGAAWMGATMFRLRSCFGRGLLLLPAGAPAMKDGSTFLLRVSSTAAN